jgi:hypothetical protein
MSAILADQDLVSRLRERRSRQAIVVGAVFGVGWAAARVAASTGLTTAVIATTCIGTAALVGYAKRVSP